MKTMLAVILMVIGFLAFAGCTTAPAKPKADEAGLKHPWLELLEHEEALHAEEPVEPAKPKG